MALTWTKTITAGETFIDSAEFAELLANLNIERARRNGISLPAINLSIKPEDADTMQVLRNGISFATSSIFSFADAINIGVLIKKTQIDELRTKLTTLNNHVYVGGSSDCASGCQGICVGCAGCSNACTSCTSCTSCTDACTSCQGCTGCWDVCTSCSGCSGCTGCGDSCHSGCGTCGYNCTGCSGCGDLCTGCTGCSGCTGCGGCDQFCSSCGYSCSHSVEYL